MLLYQATTLPTAQYKISALLLDQQSLNAFHMQMQAYYLTSKIPTGLPSEWPSRVSYRGEKKFSLLFK